MAENPDGTMKQVAATGDAKIDNELKKIANKGQSRQHKIVNALPVAADGEEGEIWIAVVGPRSYICAKVNSSTWNKTIIT